MRECIHTSYTRTHAFTHTDKRVGFVLLEDLCVSMILYVKAQVCVSVCVCVCVCVCDYTSNQNSFCTHLSYWRETRTSACRD
jgi:hypothetical protein